jgi:hypothetical protein
MLQLVFYCFNLPGWHKTPVREARVVGHEADYEHRYHVYICQLLMSDYQTADSCESVLREIENVEHTDQTTFRGSGNAWTTTITLAGVQIDSHTVPWWDEQPEGHFTLTQFKAALEGWKRFLQMPVSLESRLVVTLPDGETAT